MAMVTAIIGSAVGITGILGMMIGFGFRNINVLLKETNRRIDETNQRVNETRTDLGKRIDETNNRLERVETRVDHIGRDIGELRDRTGKLEGTLSAFIQNRAKVEAA